MKRWIRNGLIILSVLVTLMIFAMHIGAKALQAKVTEALGKNAEVGQVILRWNAVELHNIRLPAPSGWPSADSLRASKIRVEPDLRSLVSSHLRVGLIEVDDAYLSVLRPAKGPIRLLPSLLEREPPKTGAKDMAPVRDVTLDNIILNNAVLEFFDASVSNPANKLRLQQTRVQVRNLSVPSLTGKTGLKLEGVIAGIQRNGKLSINGWSDLSTKDSELQTQLHDVDLLTLKPYLIKAANTRIMHGKLDVTLNSVVQNQHLHAPGQLTLTGLELASNGGTMSTVMSLPKQAALGVLKDKSGKIQLHFTLDGKLDDPGFSLNEQLTKRIGTGVAESLGLGVEGLARTVGSATAGVTSGVKKLFGL